jgi:hypothetical protein
MACVRKPKHCCEPPNPWNKNEKTAGQTSPLTIDSQNRLLAYITAAGLRAFLANQNAGAQVVESSAFAPYPQTLIPGTGVGYYHNYFYVNVDGNTNGPEFNLDVPIWRVDISGTPLANEVLNPSTNACVIPWTNGMTINATTGSLPTYKRFLANTLSPNTQVPEMESSPTYVADNVTNITVTP